MPVGLTPTSILEIAKRPDLWLTAIRSGRSLIPSDWWKNRPFLPVPDPTWLKFRVQTAYGGSGDNEIQPRDLITWLEWSRDFPT